MSKFKSDWNLHDVTKVGSIHVLPPFLWGENNINKQIRSKKNMIILNYPSELLNYLNEIFKTGSKYL